MGVLFFSRRPAQNKSRFSLKRVITPKRRVHELASTAPSLCCLRGLPLCGPHLFAALLLGDCSEALPEGILKDRYTRTHARTDSLIHSRTHTLLPVWRRRTQFRGSLKPRSKSSCGSELGQGVETGEDPGQILAGTRYTFSGPNECNQKSKGQKGKKAAPNLVLKPVSTFCLSAVGEVGQIRGLEMINTSCGLGGSNMG